MARCFFIVKAAKAASDFGKKYDEVEKKRLLMDQDAIMRAIRRISHEILERNKGLSNAF